MKQTSSTLPLAVKTALAAILVGCFFPLLKESFSEASLMMVLCLGLYAALFAWIYVSNGKTLVEFDSVFLFLLGLYCILPGMLTTWWPDAPFLPDEVKYKFMPRTPADNVLVLRCIAVSLVGMGAGFLLSPRDIRGAIPRIDEPWGSSALTVGAFLVCLAIMLIGTLVLVIGVETYLSSSYADLYLAEGGLGFLQTGINFFQLGLFILYLADKPSPGGESPTNRSKIRMVVWLFFAVFTLLALRIGRRRVVMETGMGLFILRHYFVRPFRALGFSLILGVTLICFIAVGQMRAFMGEGLDRMVDYAKTELSVEDGAGVFHELFVVSFTTFETARAIDRGDPYRYGATYIEAFEILIPAKLHPNRPLGPSQLFVSMIDARLADRGGGYSFSHIAEAYLNLGYGGVVLISVVIGFLIRYMVVLRRGRPGSRGRLLLYAVVFLSAVVLIRADFNSLLKSYIISSWLPALLVACWLGGHGKPTKH